MSKTAKKSFFKSKEFELAVIDRNEYYAKEVLLLAVKEKYPIMIDFHFGKCFGEISNAEFPQIILDNMKSLDQDPTDYFQIESEEGLSINFTMSEVDALANYITANCLYIAVTTSRQ